MRGRVEPPGAVGEAERSDDTLGELPLRFRVEGAMEERGVDLRRRPHELGERRAEGCEHLAYLGRRHPRLVVVEQCRVGQVGRLEALDVAALQLDVRAQVGEERGEVVVLAGLDPGVVAARGGAGHLDAQFGRDAARLVVVATRDADQARVVGVVGERLLERGEPLQEAADLGIGEAVVDDAAEGRKRLGAGLGAEWRHGDALVPSEHSRGAAEVRDLGQPLTENRDVVHPADPSDRLHSRVRCPLPVSPRAIGSRR